MLRDVLDEKTENAESFTDTPTTLTDNAEETIMIKGRVSRIACQFSNRVEMNGQLDGHKRTWFVEPWLRQKAHVQAREINFTEQRGERLRTS